MADTSLRNQYESVFGAIPDSPDPKTINAVFANLGKALAAYERLLMPGPSRFDAYVEAVLVGDRDIQDEIFSVDEAAGLRLFIAEAACTQCHNGSLFTNNEFHNTGVLSFPGEVPDKGRASGVRQVLVDPFNCLGEFSDATGSDCAELEFTRTGPEILGTFRTPSLRNLQNTQPFMHKGQLITLADVLRHYNEAPLAMIGHNEAKPLGLTAAELLQLEAFLNTLAAPLSTDEIWLQPPAL
jgi:cytochrome c peroxidase